MRFILVPVLFVGFCIVPAGQLHGQEDPRAVISRSVQALGGEKRLSQARAVWMKIKGIFHESGPFPLTGEVYTQLPDQSKAIFEMDLFGNHVTLVQVLNGGKGWHRENGQTQDSDKASLDDMKESNYVNYVASLLPLLKGDRFKLATLGETKIGDQAALGINVSSAGHADVKLFFDKASGYLIKVEHRRPEPGKNGEVLREEYLSDYRDVFSPATEEQVLKIAKVATDNTALLEFVRRRTLTDARREQLNALIHNLGDAAFDVREKAKDDLIKAGEPAVALLTRALSDIDPEVVNKAKECLKAIGKPLTPAVSVAVVRLLALRQPPGATEALLAYLPCVGDESAMQEVRAALDAVARREGKPDPILVLALQDKDPQRRAAAAAALGRDAEPGKEAPGRQLFLPGIKRARKGAEFRDGKKALEYEELEVRFYNKLKEEIFARP